MTQFTQKFIEKNIDLIEDNKWDEVFLNWYNDAEEVWPAEIEFEEFMNTLNYAHIKPDMFSRYHVLYDEVVWMMENAMKDAVMGCYTTSRGEHHVGRFSLINQLHTKLGYTDEEVHKIMDDAASSLNMRYTDYYGGGYTW